MSQALATRRMASLQAEYLTNEDPEVRLAADYEISERIGRDLLGTTVLVAVEPAPRPRVPSTEAMEVAINVLRGARAQSRAYASFAAEHGIDASFAAEEAEQLTAVINFLGGAHG